MPWWCSVASTWRVPNSVANKAISSATYSAGSVKKPVGPTLPVSTCRLIATALYCNARYGTMPISAITATSAARRRERPNREEMKSAMDTTFWLRAISARRSMMRQPNTHSSSGPR